MENSVQQQAQLQHNFSQEPTSPFYCKECNRTMNSAESFEVHIQYHKENLLKHWATQTSSSHSEETNNNTPKANIKHIIHIHNLSTAPYERQQTQAQVPSSSPAYPPQPTPSPSPKQCDKCGYVCQSASLLVEHQNMNHPPTPAPHLSNYQPNQHFMFDQPVMVKQEDAQSEILDLDSHKVVHNVYPEEEKRQGNAPNSHNPHAVSTMLHCKLNPWLTGLIQVSGHEHDSQRMFMNAPDQKIFSQNIPENIPDAKILSTDQKLFQPHQIHNQDFMSNGVTTTAQENPGNGMNPPPHSYRPFEHLPSPTNAPVISSTQVPNNPPQAPSSQKGANWKSNEARRPKTYNCTACNKWFTSSGHLKRHYNTTLHKNAVKSSGQPDPAALPISAHHHPARDHASKQDDRSQSGSSGDEIRNDDTGSMPPQFDRLNTMPLLHQPPSGPYDRQPAPNIHHTTPLHSPMPPSPMAHSPMAQHHSPLGNHLVNPSLSNLSNGSPPNGEAGLSTNNLNSRGLLSLSSAPMSTVNTHHGFNMPSQHMMSMENNQFQMYPNESAPPRYAGYGYQQPQYYCFAQIQAHRYGLIGYGVANVGGEGPVTAPYQTYYTDPNNDELEPKNLIFKSEEDEYKLTILTAADTAPDHGAYMLPFSSDHSENMNVLSMSSENHSKTNIMEEPRMQMMEDIKMRLEAQPKSPEKAHTKRDYEESTGSPIISSTVVSKPGVHKCYDCDKMFNKACYLTQHNKTFHSGDKPYKCSRCGKRFSCEITYQEHLTKHAGDKPHKCDLCPKQFNHKTDLRRHMCLHTGHKPYACDTCGKGFIRKDHMMKHCETHVRKTQSRLAAIR
ncbi:hypothetical protein NQ317_013377 [Molorchus minor]|uniref:C2H2-type domain-containing protein n=1 Tax=Molorchus minor TaxID=1323400 RepID=A0ABQ9JGK6_9CUCU|nr:hypothetical protein NQ317_013377 [Molorchus minor]